MKKNIGKTDKTIRFIVGFTLLILVISNLISGLIANTALLVGALLLITGSFGFCPLYLPFKHSTCKNPPR